jgi:hypothetical protein
LLFSATPCTLYNARNIKSPKNAQKTKKVHTPPITALSEIDFQLPKTAPQTADLVAMATCHLSWAINIFFLPGFTGTKSNLKRLRKFKWITLEQGMLSTTAIVECEIYVITSTGRLTGKK